MSWFKVDDKLPDHHKARKVRKSDKNKRRDVAPFGLWVHAGAWCGENGTGGFVPLEVLEEWDDDAQVLAERLVDAGLWEPDEVDDEPGYWFHDWTDQNPATGRDRADDGRRGNHIRWHESRGVIDPDCEFCSPPPPPEDQGEYRGDIAPDSGGDSGGDIGRGSEGDSPRPDPTRPDPTRPKSISSPIADAIPDPAPPLRDDVGRVCRHLVFRIVENGSKEPAVGKTWHDAARLMLDKDARPEALVHQVIDWCQASTFWRANVMSVPTLREKFDQLRLQMVEDCNVHPIRTSVGLAADDKR